MCIDEEIGNGGEKVGSWVGCALVQSIEGMEKTKETWELIC